MNTEQSEAARRAKRVCVAMIFDARLVPTRADAELAYDVALHANNEAQEAMQRVILTLPPNAQLAGAILTNLLVLKAMQAGKELLVEGLSSLQGSIFK